MWKGRKADDTVMERHPGCKKKTQTGCDVDTSIGLQRKRDRALKEVQSEANLRSHQVSGTTLH